MKSKQIEVNRSNAFPRDIYIVDKIIYNTIRICFYLCLRVILVSEYLLVLWAIWFHISYSDKASKK